MVWGVNGLMNGCWNANATIKGLDFAGGTVVHMSSGWTGLVLCIILGKRLGFGKENFSPHSLVLTYVGTGMLWVGWYGFNSGSAVAGDIIAANAFTTTTIATAVGSFVWPMWDWIIGGNRRCWVSAPELWRVWCSSPRPAVMSCPWRILDRHRRRHDSMVLRQQSQSLGWL